MRSKFPEEILNDLCCLPGFNQSEFIEVQKSSPIFSIRKNPFKWQGIEFDGPEVPWCLDGVYLSIRPEFIRDPFFHGGHYYVQEASSMFVGELFRYFSANKKNLTILDLCAAPGGKSTHLLSIIDENSILISNELQIKRASILKENIIRWGRKNCIVTNNSPSDFNSLNEFFDLIVVDAPCSGSGLFRKMPEHLENWNLKLVEQSVYRQKNILRDILPSLKSGGVLIYSTCSFSIAENEKITQWLSQEMGMFEENYPLEIFEGILRTGPSSFRFTPGKIDGEGFYVSVLRKNGDKIIERGKKSKSNSGNLISRSEFQSVNNWIDAELEDILQVKGSYYSFPAERKYDLSNILQKLNVLKLGVKIGEQKNSDFIPDHELSLSCFLRKEVGLIELSKDDYYSYLNKKPFNVSDSYSQGYYVVSHMGSKIGWLKKLGNRVNNNLPNDWRVLKNLK